MCVVILLEKVIQVVYSIGNMDLYICPLFFSSFLTQPLETICAAVLYAYLLVGFCLLFLFLSFLASWLFCSRILPCSMIYCCANACDKSSYGGGAVCGKSAACSEAGSGHVLIVSSMGVKLTSFAPKIFADVLIPGVCWLYCLCYLRDMKTSLGIFYSKLCQSQNCFHCAGAHQPCVW